MESTKVLALRLHARRAGYGERIAQIQARPKGARGIQHAMKMKTSQPMRREPTPTQLLVISATSHGMTTQDTAIILGMAYETAKVHLRDAKLRTAAKTTAHLVAICLRNGWIS